MFSYKGRINRTTFLLGNILLLALALPIYSINEDYLEKLEANGVIIIGVLFIALCAIYFSVCLVIRRLHDLGLSGWFSFLALLPGMEFVLMLIPGQKSKNNYGDIPVKTFDIQTIFESR